MIEINKSWASRTEREFSFMWTFRLNPLFTFSLVIKIIQQSVTLLQLGALKQEGFVAVFWTLVADCIHDPNSWTLGKRYLPSHSRGWIWPQDFCKCKQLFQGPAGSSVSGFFPSREPWVCPLPSVLASWEQQYLLELTKHSTFLSLQSWLNWTSLRKFAFSLSFYFI